jgi:hypothetical protein
MLTIAAFAYRNTHDFGYETFHCEAHSRMLPRESGQRAPSATNDDLAVAFDVRHRSQVLVHHRACGCGA